MTRPAASRYIPASRSTHGGGKCRVCARWYALRSDGTVRYHVAPGEVDGCEGSRKPPERSIVRAPR